MLTADVYRAILSMPPMIDEIRFCQLYFSNLGYLVYCLFSGDILVENRNGQYLHRETGGKS